MDDTVVPMEDDDNIDSETTEVASESTCTIRPFSRNQEKSKFKTEKQISFCHYSRDVFVITMAVDFLFLLPKQKYKGVLLPSSTPV